MNKKDMQRLKTGDEVLIHSRYGWITREVNEVFNDCITIKAKCFIEDGYYSYRQIKTL